MFQAMRADKPHYGILSCHVARQLPPCRSRAHLFEMSRSAHRSRRNVSPNSSTCWIVSASLLLSPGQEQKDIQDLV